MATAGAGSLDSHLVLDVDGNIELNADGGTIELKDNTQLALKIDMSTTAGDAIFKDSGDAEIFRIDGSANSLLMATSKKIEFHDATAFVHAPGAGKLKIDAGSTAADAIIINSAGGIDITAAGDNGSVNINATEASNFTVDSNAAGEDLTIAVTGDSNSSLILSSAGTGADALQITTTAGGMDISVTGNADGEDLDISCNQEIRVTSTSDAAEAIYLRANGGTSETIKIHSDQGTGTGSITIVSDAGGIDIDATSATAGAIDILAGTTMTIKGAGASKYGDDLSLIHI